MMAARVALAVLVFAVALAAATTDAAACSCAIGDPRRMLAAADAAFVGRLVERPAGPFSSSGTLAPYVFHVERTVKGTLPERLEVMSAVSGASCGIEATVGARIGLFLRRVNGRWQSSLCEQVDADVLLAAARPLPPPTGAGPIALLAGGSFGEVRTIALDRTGRTLGYGRGRGETVLLDVCPGGTRAVEVARDWPTLSLAVRDLRTLRLVREQPLRLRENLFPTQVDCRTSTGDTTLLFASREAGPLGVILRLRGGGSHELHRGRGVAAMFGRRHAYVVTGARANGLVAVDLVRGGARRLRQVPTGTGALALSPDGSRLAAVAYSAPLPNAQPSRLLLLDLRGTTPRLRTATLGSANVSGTVHWLAGGRLVFMPGGGDRDSLRVYDSMLRLQARLAWPARLGVVRGDVAYGITWLGKARVLRTNLPHGRPRSDAALPGRAVFALAPVPPS